MMKKRRLDLSTGLSIIALIIAIVSAGVAYLPFHFQYIREKQDLKATILTAYPNFDNNKCVADIIFSNNGNRSFSITSLNLREELAHSSAIPFYKTIPALNQPPFTVEPGNVVSKSFSFGKGELRINNTGYSQHDTIIFSIVFNIIDVDGSFHRVIEPVFIGVVGGALFLDGKQADYVLLVEDPKIIQLIPSDQKIKNEFVFPNISTDEL